MGKIQIFKKKKESMIRRHQKATSMIASETSYKKTEDKRGDQAFEVAFSIEATAKSESKSHSWVAKKLSTASSNLPRLRGTQIGIWGPSRGEASVETTGLQVDSERLHARKNEQEINKPFLELKSSFELISSIPDWIKVICI